jgi:hypothetical protein
VSPTGRLPAALAFACALPAFVLLCTLNSAGYRYGASDQAFYVPAVLNELDPALYPRDDDLIESQARLTPIDETLAALVTITRLDVPEVYGALYVVTLGLLAGAAWLLGTHLYRTPWAALALLAALTLRHAIADTGTNTLEAYFHPRQLTFALGALAVVAFLRGGLAAPAALVAAGMLLHPTTALWFGIWLGAAAFVAEPRWRLPLIATTVVAGAAGAWLVTAGPLAGRLTAMDAAWLATIGTKDYLFPTDWPVEVWALNLAYVPIIWLVYRRRAAAGLTSPRERGIVAGCLALLVPFALALPLVAANIALAIQLQVARIFWMLDFLAVVYGVWWLAEDVRAPARRAQFAAVALATLSVVRGTYVMTVLFPDRPVAQVDVLQDDWGRVMAWARTTPPGSGWLADPMHAVKYGTSLRVAGERDVLVEAVKDTAIGMYSRDIAMRTQERVEAAAGFGALTPEQARALGARYGLDYLVTEQSLLLPAAFESGALRVYRLGNPAPATAGPRSPQ